MFLLGNMETINRFLRYKKRRSFFCFIKMIFKTTYYWLRLRKKIWVGGNGVIELPSDLHVGGSLDVGIIYNSFSSYSEKILIEAKGPIVIDTYAAFGDGSLVVVRKGGRLRVGNAILGPRLRLFSDEGVSIGDRVLISWDVTILDTSVHQIVGGKGRSQKVVIEDDVWVGSNVLILPGARIRRGTVVGAGSVVTKDFEEQSVLVAGNPAKIVKRNIVWER